jgi:mannobiose 2-epimerase
MRNPMKDDLKNYRTALQQELDNILQYWAQLVPDNANGGFFGQIDNNNNAEPDAAKGSVLNSRILWTFAAAEKFLPIADRAYNYITEHFIDNEYGGVYWTVDANGHPLETKKQVYASAFALYAISEYYRLRRTEDAREKMLALYRTLVDKAFDKTNGGYWEAFLRDWSWTTNQRLSSKDANERKSMNTNLHVLEAFANLYTVWPDENLRMQIADLLEIFRTKIINQQSGHLNLFFDDEWNVRPDVISYGHEIEASWLLLEAATIIDDKKLIETFRAISLKLSDVAAQGLDADGGLWYEFDPQKNKLIKQKHWWPQAEAMVGYFNAWKISGDEKYLQRSLNSWKFVGSHILDKQNGEWFWGITEFGEPMNEDKVGLWKCPYHNGRACLELIKRINITEK